jgi:hypothetical protein
MRTRIVRGLLLAAGLDLNEFVDWMRGQTVGILPDGSIDYYEHDVYAYILAKQKRPDLVPSVVD